MKLIHFACCSFKMKRELHVRNTMTESEANPWLGGIVVIGQPHKGKREVQFFIDSDGVPIKADRIHKFKVLRRYGAVSLPTGQ